MSPAAAMLMRARLHWRCGRRRLRENKITSGVATLYDALLSGMRWHLMISLVDKPPGYSVEDLENERYVFSLLRRAGLIDPSSFNILKIQDLVDRALLEEDIHGDQEKFVKELEEFLTRLKVLPYDESKLPPEDPATF